MISNTSSYYICTNINTLSLFDFHDLLCTALFIAVCLGLPGLWLLLRLTVCFCSCFRSSGLTIQLTSLQALMARTTSSRGNTQTRIANDTFSINKTGHTVTVTSHHLAQYNYSMAQLNVTSITKKTTILFGLRWSSLGWYLVMLIELGTLVLQMTAMVGYPGLEPLRMTSLALSGVWALLYLVANGMMLYNSSRDYWGCTVRCDGWSDATGMMNEHFKASWDQIRAAGVHVEDFAAAGLVASNAAIDFMVYEGKWSGRYSTLPQVLAFHRLFSHCLMILMFLSEPVAPAVFGFIAGSWIVLHIIYYFMESKGCCC
eukprot:TRINITY_DN24131_c0_g1_i1.p1 TRINITY_DN24131_c0_g1~~TRINITY_DN24131_c0_g1_i1.p1  ORF type:complete len:315 (+),score=54.04 TRINITY_DN24131_c0_g1_i1:3-947(+)